MDVRPLTEHAGQLSGMSASLAPRIERLVNAIAAGNPTISGNLVAMSGRAEAVAKTPSIVEQLERTGEQLARADKALGELERLIGGATDQARM